MIPLSASTLFTKTLKKNMKKLTTNLICSLLLGLTLAACETTPSPMSEWAPLKEASQVDCLPFPKPAGVLEVTKIDSPVAPGAPFVLEGRSRRGAAYVKHLFPFSSLKKFEDPKMIDLTESKEVYYLGMGWDGKVPVLVEEEVSGKGATMRLRAVPGLKPIGKPMKMEYATEDPKLTHSKGGAWLLSKQREFGDEQSALEDRPYFVHYANFQDGNAKVQPFKFNVHGRPKFVSMDQKRESLAVVWLDEGTAEKHSPPQFKVRLVNKSGLSSKEMPIPLKLEGAETWDAAMSKDGLVLAFIDGDSLMGDAKLRVVRGIVSKTGIKIVWQKSIPLSNQHTFSPKFVTSKEGSLLAVQRWLDNESTVSLYEITKNDFKLQGNYGVFKEGFMFADFFISPNDKALLGVSRYKDGHLKHFGLCKIRSID
jgi:hypothetical protein